MNSYLLPAALGGESATSLRASTQSELNTALACLADPAGLVVLEAVLPTMDVPEVLRATAQSLAASNGPDGR